LGFSFYASPDFSLSSDGLLSGFDYIAFFGDGFYGDYFLVG